MDGTERDGVRVWSVPGGIVAAALIGVFWPPFYDALVHGQITPVLTGVLALAMGRSPFVRGLFVGLAAALKPPFALLIPFVSISFGWRALAGCALTGSLALLPPSLFAEYLRLLPELGQRAYGDIGLVRLLGAKVSIPLAAATCLWISLRWRGREESYLGCVAAVVMGTALWFHAYTPLVLPVVYFLTRGVEWLYRSNVIFKSGRQGRRFFRP